MYTYEKADRFSLYDLLVSRKSFLFYNPDKA